MKAQLEFSQDDTRNEETDNFLRNKEFINVLNNFNDYNSTWSSHSRFGERYIYMVLSSIWFRLQRTT